MDAAPAAKKNETTSAAVDKDKALLLEEKQPHPPLDSLPREALLAAKMTSLEQRAAEGNAAAQQQLDDLQKGRDAKQQQWGLVLEDEEDGPSGDKQQE